MNKNEFEKVRAIVAEGIGGLGLDEVALAEEESAAERLARPQSPHTAGS